MPNLTCTFGVLRICWSPRLRTLVLKALSKQIHVPGGDWPQSSGWSSLSCGLGWGGGGVCTSKPSTISLGCSEIKVVRSCWGKNVFECKMNNFVWLFNIFSFKALKALFFLKSNYQQNLIVMLDECKSSERLCQWGFEGAGVLLISLWPWLFRSKCQKEQEKLLSLTQDPSSPTHKLCDLGQVTYPAWASVFPPIYVNVIYNTGLLWEW